MPTFGCTCITHDTVTGERETIAGKNFQYDILNRDQTSSMLVSGDAFLPIMWSDPSHLVIPHGKAAYLGWSSRGCSCALGPIDWNGST